MTNTSVCAIAAAMAGAVASASSGAVTNFTGGTVTFGGGGTAVTNTIASHSDVSTYEQGDFTYSFLGTTAAQFAGNYYGSGNDSLHAHYPSTGLIEMRGARTDGAAFNLDSLLVTSNTVVGGGAATGAENSFINISYDGSTIAFSQLLPSQDWGRATDTLVAFGAAFDNIRYFSFTTTNSTCIGIDDVETSVIPAPAGLGLLAGLGMLAARRSRRATTSRA